MDLIYTNPSCEDVGVLHNYELDLAFGSDENSLECVVSRNDHCCEFGSYLYIEGTEYGGIVDGIESKNSTNEVVYSGRTWHGILNSKVIQPDSGQAYLTLSGEANAVIASLLTRMGLSDLFEASSEDSGLNISNYRMNRYISGYDGILKMLKTVGAKLLFCVQSSGKVLLSAVPVVDYSKEELDSDLIDLDVKKTANTVNHLICLGSGELENRTVIHLYADADGNISQTQTFSGVDECVAVFDYSNAEDEADLISSGTERLKELMQQDDLSVDFNDVNDPYDIGDIVGATDNITNIRITVPVTKKIVTIKNGMVTIDIKTETGNVSASISKGPSGGSGSTGSTGSYYVTPQMFGAIGDGVADDTDAVQAALDCGGEIYFPAGRYKVTRQLTATKSGIIRMFKPYPSRWGGDYPITAEDNWMGARIETSASDGYGLLIGDGVEVDGLFMRAMVGFSGVLLKFDGTQGCRTYPSQVMLCHIRLDCENINIVPESMFDFFPNGTYFHILDDITIGYIGGMCQYGFRSVTAPYETNWANSVRIRNMRVDVRADFCVYIEGGFCCQNWVFENMNVQTYPYDPEYIGSNSRTGHIDVVTLKNVHDALFLGGFIWDIHAADVLGEVFHVESSSNISCFGCNDCFDEIETVLTGKLQEAADNLNIKNLSMQIEGVEETGANRLILNDGTYERTVDIPSVSVSDEQLNVCINNWFDVNAKPSEQVGRNKFDPFSVDTINGAIGASGAEYSASSLTTSNYIGAEYGDVIRISINSSLTGCYQVHCYDADKNYIGMWDWAGWSTDPISVEGTKYIRLVWTQAFFTFADRGTAKVCVTVNNSLIDYEPYCVDLIGGLGQYIVLQSPNGAKYTLAVNNDGELIANPVNDTDGGEGEEGEATGELWKLSDKTIYKNGSYWVESTSARLIEDDIYVLGAAKGGIWNSAAIKAYTIDGENITMTTTNAYGIGVPVTLKKGVAYNLSITSSEKFDVSLVSYDASGVFRSYMTLLSGAEAGTYTIQFTADEAAHHVLTLTPADAGNVTISFTDISLTKAATEG